MISTNDYKETKYGFQWGFIEVERVASNDGRDKQKKWNVLNLKHTNGDIITITATRGGFDIETKGRHAGLMHEKEENNER